MWKQLTCAVLTFSLLQIGNMVRRDKRSEFICALPVMASVVVVGVQIWILFH